MSSNLEALSEQQLNRALLARQMLLEQASCSIPEALERMGGLQAQYAPSSYIGLWSRVAGFRRQELNDALSERSVIQGTLMRITIHLVSAADYFLFAAGLRQARRSWWLRAAKWPDGETKIEELARRTRDLLADGPRKRSQLLKDLGIDNFTWVGVGLWVDLVRVPPSGTWEHRRADLYALAEQWLEPSDPSPEQGIDHLLSRYLGAFGPAETADIVSWSGLPASVVIESLGRLDLRSYESAVGKRLFDLPDGTFPNPDVAAPVRLLPTWDATLLAHARRTQILPEKFKHLVFHTKTPHSINTFTVDGRVPGSWRLEGGTASAQPFEELSEDLVAEVWEEMERIAAALR
jgi:hypothetical protein